MRGAGVYAVVFWRTDATGAHNTLAAFLPVLMKTTSSTYSTEWLATVCRGKILLGIAVDSPQRSEDYKRKARPEGEQASTINYYKI